MVTAVASRPARAALPATAGMAPFAGSRPGRAWSPQELLTLATWASGQLRPVQDIGRPVSGHRHYELLDRARDYEMWLIRWPQDDGLVLHDHGGSAGAFFVAAGVLEETGTSLASQRLRRRFVPRGAGHGFGPEYVHSVVNPAVAPATSVHAYSPPLPSMTFYATSPTGLLVSHVETEWDGAP